MDSKSKPLTIQQAAAAAASAPAASAAVKSSSGKVRAPDHLRLESGELVNPTPGTDWVASVGPSEWKTPKEGKHDGFLDNKRVNGSYNELLNLIQEQVFSNLLTTAPLVHLVHAHRLITGLTLDGCTAIRLAASNDLYANNTQQDEKTGACIDVLMKANFTVSIVQNASPAIVHNLATFKKHAPKGSLSIELVKPSSPASYSSSLNTHMQSLRGAGHQNTVLWLDSSDWMYPTRWFYEKKDPMESMEEILLESPFDVAIVIQRNTWWKEVKGTDRAALSKKYTIYEPAESALVKRAWVFVMRTR